MNKFLSQLGMAKRAGKLVLGEENILNAIRSKQAKIVFIAEDASPNTKKRIMDKCSYYEISCKQIGSRDELGNSIGKQATGVIAIKDEGFAKMFQAILKNLSEVKRFD